MGPLIAAAIYDGLPGFEYSIAWEVLGRDRRDIVDDWYEFLPCRVEDGPLHSQHGMQFEPAGSLADLARAHTVLIPGWRGAVERPPEPFLEAIRDAHAQGVRLVTICTGVFVPAHAGLLDGRTATTHWMHVEALRTAFPRIEVQDDALYVKDTAGPGPIYTSAGSAAGLDLCFALVREDFGLTVSNAIARRVVAPVHRDGGQSQYADCPAGVCGDQSFGPVLDWMIAHLDQDFAMHQIARRFGYSLRTFQRRFKEITSLSPHQWLVRQRLGRARELLESSDESVERIATESGLGSAANLRKHLARHLGTTPRAYRSAFRAGN
ncbi:MAG: helix-turn-helix domain-containing protein [Acidobacteriota bacterium]